jgi:hypothetical protein
MSRVRAQIRFNPSLVLAVVVHRVLVLLSWVDEVPHELVAVVAKVVVILNSGIRWRLN